MQKLENKDLVTYSIAGVLIIGFIVLLYFVLKKLFNPTPNITKETEKEVTKSNLSYSESEYMNFAESIYNAMDGYSTRTEIVLSIIKKLKNVDDWKMLEAKFGERGSSYNSFWWWFNGDLVTWIQEEFGEGDDLNTIKSHLQSIGAVDPF